jgi:hypothetical protein
MMKTLPKLHRLFPCTLSFALSLSLTIPLSVATPADTIPVHWERLEVSNVARVTLVQGDGFRLQVDGVDWISDTSGRSSGEKRDWEIDGEWLRINKFTAKEITVQQPRLQEIRIKGAVSLQSDGVMRDDLLRIGISGVGYVFLDLDMEEIMADLNGVGRLSLKGRCSKARIDINGPGMVDAKALKVRQAKVFIDGLGLCKMDVTDSLYAEITGGGSIRYRQEPGYLVNRISGLGSITAWESDALPNASDSKSGKGENSEVNRRSGDFWSGRKGRDPRRPFLELGLAHWVSPLGGSLGKRWNSTREPYDLMEPEAEKSWFLNWWTPLQHEVCLTGSGLYAQQQSTDGADFRKGVVGGRGLSVWARGAMVLAFQSLRFEDNVVLSKAFDANGNKILLAYQVDTIGSPRFARSRLENLQLQFPLMINIHNGRRPHKGWHVGGGIVPGIRLWTRSLNRYRDDGGFVEIYRTGNFYLNPFSLALRSEIGYGRFRMFTQYSVNSMFRTDYGPRVNRVDLGITLLSY